MRENVVFLVQGDCLTEHQKIQAAEVVQEKSPYNNNKEWIREGQQRKKAS